jgi:hypothetical protein
MVIRGQRFSNANNHVIIRPPLLQRRKAQMLADWTRARLMGVSKPTVKVSALLPARARPQAANRSNRVDLPPVTTAPPPVTVTVGVLALLRTLRRYL